MQEYMACYALGTHEAKAGRLCEFEASMAYIVNSRTARNIYIYIEDLI